MNSQIIQTVTMYKYHYTEKNGNKFPEKEIYAELYYLRSGKRKGHLFTQEDIDEVKSLIYKPKSIDDYLTIEPDNHFYCDLDEFKEWVGNKKEIRLEYF